MSWQTACLIAALAYFVVCGIACIGWRRHQRNKRINLPPPSSACRRNGVESL